MVCGVECNPLVCPSRVSIYLRRCLRRVSIRFVFVFSMVNTISTYLIVFEALDYQESYQRGSIKT